MPDNDFTPEARARLVRRYWRAAKCMFALCVASFVGAVASIPLLGFAQDGNTLAGWLIGAFALFSIGAAMCASKSDSYKYGLALPDLDGRLKNAEDRAARAWELADSAHDRIAQIERMGQQGRVVIPDTLNVRLTKERS